jgi:beta-1,4-N-acetylglucosaminyltransferase
MDIADRRPPLTPPARRTGSVVQGGTFVTAGSSTKYPFRRLIDLVLDTHAALPQPVLIQSAESPGPLPTSVSSVRMLTHEDFLQRLAAAQLLICHAGAGTIIEALRLGVPAVVMPRRPDLGEIADEHQLELAAALSALGLIRVAEDSSSLSRLLTDRGTMARPVRHAMNQAPLVEQVKRGIAIAMARGVRAKIALVATSGGHMAELRQLQEAYEGLPHFFVASKPHASDALAGQTYVFPSSDRDWRVLLNVPSIARMLLRERPGIVLSTGSGSTIPVIALARLLGARVIYVETVTRVLRPSFTARVVHAACDLCIVRWPAVASRLPGSMLIPVVGGPGPNGPPAGDRSLPLDARPTD